MLTLFYKIFNITQLKRVLRNRKDLKDMSSPIYFIERNIHGALVIHGLSGTVQYYGYTKKQAKKMYIEKYNAVNNKDKNAR